MTISRSGHSRINPWWRRNRAGDVCTRKQIRSQPASKRYKQYKQAHFSVPVCGTEGALASSATKLVARERTRPGLIVGNLFGKAIALPFGLALYTPGQMAQNKRRPSLRVELLIRQFKLKSRTKVLSVTGGEDSRPSSSEQSRSLKGEISADDRGGSRPRSGRSPGHARCTPGTIAGAPLSLVPRGLPDGTLPRW